MRVILAALVALALCSPAYAGATQAEMKVYFKSATLYGECAAMMGVMLPWAKKKGAADDDDVEGVQNFMRNAKIAGAWMLKLTGMSRGAAYEAISQIIAVEELKFEQMLELKENSQLKARGMRCAKAEAAQNLVVEEARRGGM